MKKLLSSALLVCLLTAMLFPTPALAAHFPDVGQHWAETYIDSLSGTGYIKGYPDGTFKPDNTITRAEFATLLINCMELTPAVLNAGSFKDTGTHWARKYIDEAVRQGILFPSEYTSGLVPDGAIKRSEASAMLVRALGEKPDTGELPPFTDLSQVEQSDYKAFIKRAFDLRLLQGYPGGEFKPFTDMTRAQAAKVLTDFLTLYTGTAPQPGLSVSGDISSIAIGEEQYQLNQYPATFKFAYSSVPVTSITVSDGQVTVNGNYTFFTDTSLGNPQLVINNNLYTISKYTISGKVLVAFPESHTIDSLEVSGYKYNADFVKLYINSSNSDYYLSDMEIVDEYTIRIDGDLYDLMQDRLTVTLGDIFYDIVRIDLNAANPLRLSETDRVIVEGMDLSDISAIFVDGQTISLKNIDEIQFLIGMKMYDLNKIVIDGTGSFTIGRDTYDFDEVAMYIDGQVHTIDDIELYRDKFIFYCSEGRDEELVQINGKYYVYDDVQVIYDSRVYALDQVLVISRNLVRIGGKRYDIDSSFYVRLDKKYYEINRIDFDEKQGMIVMKLTETKAPSSVATQPDRIIFYVDDSKYQDGVDRYTEIRAGSTWVDFGQITIVDPATFSYDGKDYDLIDAQIRLDGDKFFVVDTSWTGSRQVFSIYME